MWSQTRRQRRLDITLTLVIVLGIVCFLVVWGFIFCRTAPYDPNPLPVKRSQLRCGDILLTIPKKGHVTAEHVVRQLAMRSMVLHVAVVLDAETIYESTGKGGAGAQIISMDAFLERRQESNHVLVRQATPRLSAEACTALRNAAQERVGTPYDYSIWSLTVDPLLPPHAIATEGGLYCTSAVWEVLQAAGVLGKAPERRKLLILDDFASWRERLVFPRTSDVRFTIERVLQV